MTRLKIVLPAAALVLANVGIAKADVVVRRLEGQDKAAVLASVGDTIGMAVTSPGGIPFYWQYEIRDAGKISYVSETSQVVGEAMPGAPMEYRYDFKVTAEGCSDILLRQVNVGEAKEIADQFALTVCTQ